MALEGLDKVIGNLNKKLNALGGASAKELQDIGLDLMGKSARDAPVDTGDLRGSHYAALDGEVYAIAANEGGTTGTLVQSKKGNKAHYVEVGSSVPYAVKQHEDLTLKHPRGGKAKFLEDNVKQDSALYAERIARRLRGEVDKP